ncbi:MAG: FkbM family methyltransferase [Microgenomates group bacterium]
MKQFTQLQKLLNHPLNSNRKIKTFARIVWWKFNQLFLNIPAIIEMAPGAKLICYPQSSYGSFVVYANFPEYNEMRFIQNFVKDGDIVLDVGANIGSISILAASRGEKVRVFAFEPTEKIIPLVKENIGVNGFEERIKIYQTAVSHKNGFLQFTIENESEINHLTSKRHNSSTSVKSLRLDTFVKRTNISRIDLLKIDVEGAEMLVLSGAKKLIQKNQIETIIFEVNENIQEFGSSVEEMFTFLRNNNYVLYSFNEKGTLTVITNTYTHTITTNVVAIVKKPSSISKIKRYNSYVSYS